MMVKSKLLCLILVLSLWLATAQLTFAQSPETCEAFADEQLTALQAACTDLESGSVCSLDGELAQLGEIVTVTDNAAIFQVDAPTPVTFIPFGNVELTNVVETVELTTFTATNAVGYNVNMREGAGTGFPVVGAFEFNAELVADGRNADGTWIRLQTPNGIAWVSADLARVDGDISQLAVLETFYTQPMQALRFTQTDSECGMSGLLIQASDEGLIQIQVNGIDLKLQPSTALLVEDFTDGIKMSVLAGELSYAFNGNNYTAETGSGAELGFAEDETPTEFETFPFADVADAPLGLLSSAELGCIAGVEDATAVYPNPNPEANPLAELTPFAHYTVTAQAIDEADTAWWRLTSSQGQAWIPQADVNTLGDCETVGTIDLNAPVAGNGGGAAIQVTGNPEAVITSYLTARVSSDAGTLQALSCGAWQGQAALQADSFRSMDARLEGMACYQDGTDSQYAYVACSGKIITTYNGQSREWVLGRYRLVQEGGSWKMCGEAN